MRWSIAAAELRRPQKTQSHFLFYTIHHLVEAPPSRYLLQHTKHTHSRTQCDAENEKDFDATVSSNVEVSLCVCVCVCVCVC